MYVKLKVHAVFMFLYEDNIKNTLKIPCTFVYVDFHGKDMEV